MNLLKRIQRYWKLTKKDPIEIERILSDKQMLELPDEDNKAVFISYGTHEEYEEQLKDDKGFKNIFGIGL